MKVAIITILIALYLSFSHKCKSLVFYWKEQLVEISIITMLILYVIFSYNNEAFVWMLIVSMIVHQIIQLSIEVKSRLKKQKIEEARTNERIRYTA